MKDKFLFLITCMILISGFSFVSSAALPTVGGSDGTWGTELNEFLGVTLNATGHIDSVNLNLNQRITFALGEIIDNIADGWIRITGGLNVTGGNVTVDNATFFVDSTNNRIGIGKTDPKQPLDVVGNANISGVLTVNGITINDTIDSIVGNGTYALNSTIAAYVVAKNNSLGSYVRAKNDTLATWVTTNYLDNAGDTATGNYTFDNATLHIDSTNNRIGIGRTDPDSTLDVSGTGNISGILTVNGITINDTIDSIVGNGTYALNSTIAAYVVAKNNSLGTYVISKNTTMAAYVVAKNNSLGTYVRAKNDTLATWATANFLDNDGDTATGNYDFNGGWESSGLSIIGGDIYAQTGFFYNITGLSVNTLAVNGSIVPHSRFNNTFDLGNSSLWWRDLYLGRNAYVSGTVNVTGGGYFLGSLGIGNSTPISRLHAAINDASNTSATNLLTLDHTTSGLNNGSAGIGTGILFRAEDSKDNITNVAQIQGIFTTATAGSEASALTFFTRTAGGALAERVRIDNGGQVGIGTSNPLQKLNVVGTGNITSTLIVNGIELNDTIDAIVGNGTYAINSTIAAYVVAKNNTLGTYVRAKNDTLAAWVTVNFAENSINSSYLRDTGDTATGNYTFDNATFFVDSTNNRIGIGKTDPKVALDVSGTGNISGILTVNGITINDTINAFLGNGSFTSADSSVFTSSGLTSYNDTTGFKLGIGTANPNTTLHLNRGDANNLSATNILILDHVTTGLNNGTAGIGTGILFRSEDSLNNVTNVSQIQGIFTTATAGSEDSALTFFTRVGGGALAERVRINGSGYLGLGTTNPLQVLNVVGNANITGDLIVNGITINNTIDSIVGNGTYALNSTIAAYVVAKNNSLGTYILGKNYLQWSNALNGTLAVNSSLADYARWSETGNGTLTLNSSLADYARWSEAGNGTLARIDTANLFGAFNQTFDSGTLFIDSTSNNIGIGTGTTTPDAKLHISTGDNSTIPFRINGTNGTGTSLTRFYVQNGSGNVGIGTTNPLQKLNVVGTGNITSTLIVNGIELNDTINAFLGNSTFTGKIGWSEAVNGTLAINSTIAAYVIAKNNSLGTYVISKNTTMAAYVVAKNNTLATWATANFLDNDGDTATGNYTFDTSTFFIDSTSNRIGINTTTPRSALTVKGTLNITRESSTNPGSGIIFHNGTGICIGAC